MFNAKEIKFRSSGTYHLMTNLETITEKQLDTLKTLQEKPKRTAIQENTLKELIAKRDKEPEAPAGLISHLWDIYDSAVYGIREDISSKQIDKGNICEEDSLGLLSSAIDYYLVKNKTHFSNDWQKGTPDALWNDVVIDTKTSWNLRTFRNADLSLMYYWQLMSYMWLTGSKKGLLAYGLVDTPEEIIQDEIRRQTYYKGVDDSSEKGMEIEKQVRANMTFEDKIPAKNRLKTFWIERDEKKIDQIKMRVEMCWEKLDELHKIETEYLPEILKQ